MTGISPQPYTMFPLTCSATERKSGVCVARFAYDPPEVAPNAGVSVPIPLNQPHQVFLPLSSQGKPAALYPLYDFQRNKTQPNYGCWINDPNPGTLVPSGSARPKCVIGFGDEPWSRGSGCYRFSSGGNAIGTAAPKYAAGTFACSAPPECPADKNLSCTGGWQCVAPAQGAGQPCTAYSCKQWECVPRS